MAWNLGPGMALIAEYFFKTTIILLPALLAAAVLKKRAAAFRHYLLSFALIGLLFVPLGSLFPVGWQTPLIPARWSGGTASERPSSYLSAAEARFRPGEVALPVEKNIPIIESSSALPSEKNFSASEMKTAFPAGDSDSALVAALKTGEIKMSVPPDRADSDLGRTKKLGKGRAFVDGTVIFLWLSGIVALFLRLAFGLSGAIRLTREGENLNGPAWRILIERFLSIVSLRRNVRLRSHPEVSVPMTWGWLKPVILMPAGADAWAETDRSSALFHELSHVKRADYLFTLLVRFSLAVFWWNPLCWLVFVRIRKAQEIACDELVLRAGIKPSIYAASLLAFRRSAGFRWDASSALLGLLGGASFQERLAAVLKEKMIIKEVNMKSRIMLAASVILAVAFIGTARPAVGIETNKTASPGLTDQAAPASPDTVVAQETQAEKAVVQEKEKEKDKAKIKDIGIPVDKDGKTPIEITIVENGKTRKLVLNGPLTIKTDKDGRLAVWSLDKEGFQVLKDDDLNLLGEADVLKIDENKSFTISDKDGTILIVEKSAEGKPGLKIAEEYKIFKDGQEIEIAEDDIAKDLKITKEFKIEKGDIDSDLEIVKEIESGKDGVKIIIEKKKIGKPGESAWFITKPEKNGIYYNFRKNDGSIRSRIPGGKGALPRVFLSGERDKELLEKVRAIREQVEAVKAKKLDFAELEKSLEKLEAELKANEEKINNLTLKMGKTGNLWTLGEDGDQTIARVNKRVKEGETAEADMNMVSIRGKGAIEIVLKGKKGSDGRAAYDRALDKLKKELPKNGTLGESQYDEESGVMRFKIDIPWDEGEKVEVIKKLVDDLSAEIKK